jgi:hypothetical protein
MQSQIRPSTSVSSLYDCLLLYFLTLAVKVRSCLELLSITAHRDRSESDMMSTLTDLGSGIWDLALTRWLDRVIELIEGKQNIVPGTITFTDLGLAEAAWVRSALLDEGLKCLHITLEKQPKLDEVDFKDWRVSALTGLPLLAQRCTKTWEAIVRAIRDINGQERGRVGYALFIWMLLKFTSKVPPNLPNGLSAVRAESNDGGRSGYRPAASFHRKGVIV